ncbi:MAG: 2-C-methyl-D-erythritol 4-phosphate cytidylyltransferase [bacterium]|nr:2-C-methyl-D-erythritol 4-phosphate cytidylyltransferase [bacterium]
MSNAAIIVAAGSSIRLGGKVPKQFREVCGRPLLSWTISRFEEADSIDTIVVVVSDEYQLFTSEKVVDPYGFSKVSKVVVGGESRQESVLRGLEALPLVTKLVAIHDGARPLIRPEDIAQVMKGAETDRAAIVAIPMHDTVKRAEQGFVIATLDRSRLYRAQTPQAFQYDLIIGAHRGASSGAVDEALAATDDADLIERLGFKVKIVEPGSNNMKVTSGDDLMIVESLISRAMGGS